MTLAAFLFFKGLSKVFEGILRGLGKHLFSVGIIVIAYYFISIPLMQQLVFREKIGLTQLWLVPIGAAVFEFALYNMLIKFVFDWDSIKA